MRLFRGLDRKAIKSLLTVSLLHFGSVGTANIASFENIQSLEALELDPFIWLEEVESEASLTWVESQNEISLARLKANPFYATIKEKMLEVAAEGSKVASPSIAGGMIYNFYTSQERKRGVMQRQGVEGFNQGEESWVDLFDIDKIAEEEGKNWVYKGSDCLEPEFRFCLIFLSDGGKDAITIREFDTGSNQFVEKGFVIKEAKSRVIWQDHGTVIVGSDFGEGSLTESGYPRTIRRVKRGIGIEQSTEIFAGDASDVIILPMGYVENVGAVVTRAVDFFTTENYVVDDEDNVQKISLPGLTDFSSIYKKSLVAVSQENTEIGGVKIKSGDLLAADLTQPSLPPQILYSSPEGTSISQVLSSKDAIYLAVIENVQSKILKLEIDEYSKTKITDLNIPKFGLASILSADEENLYYQFQSFFTPKSLVLAQFEKGQDKVELKTLQQANETFEAEGKYEVRQEWVTSTGDIKVPYYIIAQKGFFENPTPSPVLQYGYGGFNISLLPRYLSHVGPGFLEQGGVYVLTNIRGGGEFGPEWHQAALKTNRQLAYDDFINISKQLIAKNYTSSEKLFIAGGSNGGLLVGTAMTQAPELYQGVYCAVPLLDMLRFHLLLAGASWVGEYGSPEIPEERDYLAGYSPYQNLNVDVDYPTPFFLTSTKDDRVHPGHARKMAAKMESLGYDYFYFENLDGGHAAATNIEETAERRALEYTYYQQMLGK